MARNPFFRPDRGGSVPRVGARSTRGLRDRYPLFITRSKLRNSLILNSSNFSGTRSLKSVTSLKSLVIKDLRPPLQQQHTSIPFIYLLRGLHQHPLVPLSESVRGYKNPESEFKVWNPHPEPVYQRVYELPQPILSRFSNFSLGYGPEKQNPSAGEAEGRDGGGRSANAGDLHTAIHDLEPELESKPVSNAVAG